MPDQISLFPESFPLFDNSLKKDTGSDREQEKSSLDEFFSRTKASQNAEGYFNLLKFITRFTNYSPLNCYLIHTQNPYSSYVTTANQWLKKFGRRVNPEARPIVILAPMSPVLFVYDVADTEGKPLPTALAAPLDTKGNISQTTWNNTIDNCARDLIKVYESEVAVPGSECVIALEKAELAQVSEDEIYAALYSIQINKKHSISQKYAAAVHELAHLYCGHIGSDKTAWWTDRQDYIATRVQREIEAESISYIVCKRQKIETPTAEYLIGDANQSLELPEFSLDTVLRVASHIEGMGRRVVKKRKKKVAP